MLNIRFKVIEITAEAGCDISSAMEEALRLCLFHKTYVILWFNSKRYTYDYDRFFKGEN